MNTFEKIAQISMVSSLEKLAESDTGLLQNLGIGLGAGGVAGAGVGIDAPLRKRKKYLERADAYGKGLMGSRRARMLMDRAEQLKKMLPKKGGKGALIGALLGAGAGALL